MYRVTVVNDQTGETVLNEMTDLVIGAVHKENEKFTSFTYCESDTLALGGAIASVFYEAEHLMATSAEAAVNFAEIRSNYLRKSMGVQE